MSNRKNILEFISRLSELFSLQQHSLVESLEIIEGGRHSRRIKNAATYLKNQLLQGNRFSNVLRTCSELNFDRTFISFVELAERSGKLTETLTFLKKRSQRQDKILQTVYEAAVYPVFVLILSVFISAFLCWLSKCCLGSELFNLEVRASFIQAFFFLIVFCFFMFLLLKNQLGDNRLYEAFLSTGFLIKSGVNAATAVGLGAGILGLESRLGQVFINARLRMEYGMELERAFFAHKRDIKMLGKDIQQAFYYAQKSGGKNDVFEKIALALWSKYEKKCRVWLSMIEPLFIAGTGIFVGLLLVNFLMPLINGLNLF